MYGKIRISLVAMLLIAFSLQTASGAVKITSVSVSPRILLDIYTAYEKGGSMQLVSPHIFMMTVVSDEKRETGSMAFNIEIKDGDKWVARTDFSTTASIVYGTNTYNAGQIDASNSRPVFNRDYKPDFSMEKLLTGAVLPMANYRIAFTPQNPAGPPYYVNLALFTPAASLSAPAVPVYPRDVAVNNLLPVFNWMPANDAKSYEIVVGTNVDPEVNAYWKSGKISATQAVYDSKARALKTDEKYYWKIISYNAFGQPVGGNDGRSQVAWFKINNHQKTGLMVTPDEADRVVRQVIKDQKLLRALRDYKAVGLETDSEDLAELLQDIRKGSARIIENRLQ